MMAVLNLFARHRYVMNSPYSPSECAARLQAVCISWSFPANLSLEPRRGTVQGWVSANRFTVKGRPVFVRNSLSAIASGSFSPCNGGTRIDLRIGIAPVIPLLILLALAMALVVLGPRDLFPWFGRLLANPAAPDLWRFPETGFTLIPVLVPAVLFLAYWVGRRDEAFLHATIRHTLAATDL